VRTIRIFVLLFPALAGIRHILILAYVISHEQRRLLIKGSEPLGIWII
jgi:hypothetical protein